MSAISEWRDRDRRPLSVQIYEVLLEQIVTGTLQPRSRIMMDDLVDQFQVSRTPIREAITQLS